ncbi:hypothetical protein AMELA_G00113920 [Ameiurus melas]|uniref:Uncharacterized protein n=1 Tax=Ameiurus melas TaxID=219545 RepID=A0A7J6AR56_AMEME|nr:hypothetical protein AMELA_G00113920 [Ameiurus melas]
MCERVYALTPPPDFSSRKGTSRPPPLPPVVHHWQSEEQTYYTRGHFENTCFSTSESTPLWPSWLVFSL